MIAAVISIGFGIMIAVSGSGSTQNIEIDRKESTPHAAASEGSAVPPRCLPEEIRKDPVPLPATGPYPAFSERAAAQPPLTWLCP